MNKIICYFNSDYVDIKINSSIIHIISNSIFEGDIVNKELFIKDIKQKKIFSNIFNNRVYIYLNHYVQEKDEIYYKSIFEELNCKYIKLFDTSKQLVSPTLINSNDFYILFYDNKYHKILPKVLNSILKIYKIHELRIISKEKLPLNKNTKYYYYNYNDNYFIN